MAKTLEPVTSDAGLIVVPTATFDTCPKDLTVLFTPGGTEGTLTGFGAIPTDERMIRDRNRITGAGVTAGLDFGLLMVAELRNKIYAECSQLMSEYDPHPPFNAGSMHTAPAEVKKAMTELVADFSKQAEVLSARYHEQHLS